MSEQIAYDENCDTIIVVSNGDIACEEWRHSISRILELSRRHNCAKVLVDISGQGSLPGTVRLFEFGEELPSDLRFAVVYPGVVSPDHRFLQAVAVNRGKEVCLFRQTEEAICWLNSLREKRS